MLFLLLLIFAVLLSFVIIYLITLQSEEGFENFERCLCSPLGQPQCSSYQGLSQASKNYNGYNTYQDNMMNNVANNVVVAASPLNIPVQMSQADRMYNSNSNAYVPITSMSNDVVQMASLQSIPVQMSQADRMYNFNSNAYFPTSNNGMQVSAALPVVAVGMSQADRGYNSNLSNPVPIIQQNVNQAVGC